MENQTSGVTVDFDVPATMRDGAVLRANIYRPSGEGTWPVLLTRLPYGKNLPVGSAILDPVQAARRGYVVIVQDTRGCWASEGDWYPFMSEADDGVDTIAWAAALPYADGQVGMYGASYFGFTQWAAAVQQPPALRALVPSVTWANSADGMTSRGGAQEFGLGASWHMQMGFGELARRHAGDGPALGKAIWLLAQEIDALGCRGYRELPLAEYPPLRRHGVGQMYFDAFAPAQEMMPKVVAATTLVGRHVGVQVPAFNIGGWYDIFLAGTIENFNAMRSQGKPTKMVIGPWTHGGGGNPIGEVNFGLGAQNSFLDLRTDLGSLHLRWFDHWLKARDTGMMDEPPIKLFVMGANLWRDEQEWPLARAVASQWYLHADGMLSRERPDSEPPDSYDYDPADPTPTRGGALLMTPEFPPGPYDQRLIEARADVLVYRGAPLEHDVEVTGPIAVRLWAISSAPDTDFVARLTDVFPDGRSINLTDGIIRARYRDFTKGEAPSLIEPGRAYEYEIDLWATSNLFKAGHRIGLQIASSNFPRWDRNPNTGHPVGADAELAVAHQQILHDREHPSCVVLPLVEGVRTQS